MEHSPVRIAITIIPLYFVTTVSVCAKGATDLTTCEQGSLLERLTDPKDWIIGFVVGVIGGLVAVALLSFRVPKLRISPYIGKPHAGKKAHTIQVINKRKSWWLVTGDAIDIRAELHVVTNYEQDGAEHVTPAISLFRPDPFIISHKRRFGRLPGLSEYIFDVKDQNGVQPDLEKRMKEAEAIRFRVYARDSFSNYGKIFTLYYQKRKSRWWERPRDWLARFLPEDARPPYPIIDCRTAREIHPRG